MVWLTALLGQSSFRSVLYVRPFFAESVYQLVIGLQFAKGNKIGRGFHFTSGVSGNPKGRPKNNKITDQLHKLLDEGLNGMDVAEALARIAISKALAGDYRFLAMILDRTEGKVPDAVDTSPMSTLTVRYANLSDIQEAISESSGSKSDSLPAREQSSQM